MTPADQLLDNLATGVYDDVLGDTFTFMEFLKVFHPAEYKARMEKHEPPTCPCGSVLSVVVHWSPENSHVNDKGEWDCGHSYWVGAVFMGHGVVIKDWDSMNRWYAADATN